MKITMNTLDGVTLKTKNKYVNEDIAVAVSDEAINEKLTEITIDKDGTYEPTEDSIGFSKVVVDTNKPKEMVQITIPEEGEWINTLFTFDIDDEWTLLSNAQMGTGLWLYNKITGEHTKLLSGYYFRYFYKINDRVIITSGNTQVKGLWVYYHNTKTVQPKYTSDSFGQSCVINDTVLIGNGGNHTLTYNYDSDTIEEMFFDNTPIFYARFQYSYKYGNKILFYGQQGNYYGFYIYDNDTKEVRLLSQAHSSPTVIINGNGFFASYRDNGSIYYYVKFDEDTETFIYANSPPNTNISTTYVLNGEKGTLFWQSSSSYKGAWWYDVNDKTFDKIIDDSYGYSTSYTKFIGDYIFICASSTNLNGIILYDIANKNIVRPLETGHSYISIEYGNSLFLGGTNSSYKGLYLYNMETQETKTIDETLQFMGTVDRFLFYKDKILFVTFNETAIFDTNDETVKKASRGDSFKLVEISGDYVYWSGGASTSMAYCYDYQKNEVYSPISTFNGKYVNAIKLIDDVCYAYNTNPIEQPYTIKFDKQLRYWEYASLYLGEL